MFDLTETEHVHASTLLNNLPDVKFARVEEVIEALKKLSDKGYFTTLDEYGLPSL